MNITLEERWNHFKQFAPIGTPPQAIEVARQGFYAGVLVMIDFYHREIPELEIAEGADAVEKVLEQVDDDAQRYAKEQMEKFTVKVVKQN